MFQEVVNLIVAKAKKTVEGNTHSCRLWVEIFPGKANKIAPKEFMHSLPETFSNCSEQNTKNQIWLLEQVSLKSIVAR